MQCAGCGYPLWNMKTRVCPECGTAFSPSATRFAPSSVKFCCPHCDQQYFGTDANGHLVPPAFDCVRCGRAVTMDEMVVRPIEGVVTKPIRPDDMPWLERASRGTAKAWLQTIGRAMTAPASLMRAIPIDAPARGAWVFMLVNVAIFFVAGQLPGTLLSMVFLGSMGRARGVGPPFGGGPLSLFGGLMNFNGVAFLVGFAMMLAGVALWMALTHLLLRLFGGAVAPARRSWHALGYSSAAAAAMAIPCGCGYYPGVIWWLVAASVMLGIAHPGSGARAAWACIAAAAIVGVLQFGIYVTFTVLMLRGVGGTFGGAFTPPPAPRVAMRSAVSDAVRQFARQNGRWPAHGLALLGKPLQPSDFSATSHSAGASAPAFGNTSLFLLESMPADWPDIAEDAAAALPADVVAHRVGDLVFTFHGLPVNPRDQLLWVAVQVPQVGSEAAPEASAADSDQTFMAIIFCVNGQTNTIAVDALPDAVVMQNLARKAAGLPPLPKDLAAVRVGQPARADGPP